MTVDGLGNIMAATNTSLVLPPGSVKHRCVERAQKLAPRNGLMNNGTG